MIDLDFGEYWIYYIEIVKQINKFPVVIARVNVREKVKNINKFERQIENEINAKVNEKVKIQATAKRRLTKIEHQIIVQKVGEAYISIFKNGGESSDIYNKFKLIPKDTIKNYISEYFKINKIGVKK